MRLIGNYLNQRFFRDLVLEADNDRLEGISLAVAFAKSGPVNQLLELASKRSVPVVLHAVADGVEFPSLRVIEQFLDGPSSWQLFLVRRVFHPKIVWFRGVGAYIGSANLTDGGWMKNLECGVWFSEDELERENLLSEISSIFDVLEDYCTPARREHLESYERLKAEADRLRGDQDKFKDAVDRELASLPGDTSPIVVSKGRRESPARRKFISSWRTTIEQLRKLAKRAQEVEWPSWLPKETHPAIVQDRASEHWYHLEIRKSYRARERIRELHVANRRSPDRAIEEMYASFAAFENPDDDWIHFATTGPRRVRELLARDAMFQLDAERLGEVLFHTHAAREHIRQIPLSELGVGGDSIGKRERCERFAENLFRIRSSGGKEIRDVLDYVVWGDGDIEERIWNASHSDRWKLPRLGPSSLGELVGYARPDRYPPRNDRAARVLVALGLDGISW